MMNTVLTALLMTLIAGAATGIGGALVLFKKKISSNFLPYEKLPGACATTDGNWLPIAGDISIIMIVTFSRSRPMPTNGKAALNL